MKNAILCQLSIFENERKRNEILKYITEIDNNRVVPKYLFYLLQREHLEDLNTAGGVPSLTQTVLNKVQLRIPSLDKQNKVVECLDNFDRICSDLNIGLPAEIEARKKL